MPPSTALLVIGLFAAIPAAASDVPIEVILQFEEEPTVVVHDFANPCAFDLEGNPVEKPKDCAGNVRAGPKPHQDMGWSLEEKNGQVSAVLDYVKVPFALRQVLRVSSSYPKDGCAYKATLEHETKHWKANVELFKKAAKDIKADIEHISVLPSKAKPLVASKFSSARYREQIDKLVYAKIDEARKSLAEAMRASVAELDDPERYRKDDWSKCTAQDWKGK